MIRTLNVVLVCTTIAALVGVYALKYSVEETAGQRRVLERQIERQQGELSLRPAVREAVTQHEHLHVSALSSATSPNSASYWAQTASAPCVRLT